MNPDRNVSGPRESAPYGKACVGCYKVKCRCIPRGNGESCERCHRLGRDCQPSQVARKRATRKPAPKTMHLEEKLDDLVSLLRSQTSEGPKTVQLEERFRRTPATVANVDELPTSRGFRPAQPAEWQQQRREMQENEASILSPGPSPYYLTPQGSDSPFPPEPSPSQADEYLDTFRNHHLRNFPFFRIPPEQT